MTVAQTLKLDLHRLAETGVAVLRATSPAALGGAVAEAAECASRSRALLITLPAGPYRYPYACALELSRLLSGRDAPAPLMGAEGLSRARMAEALLPWLHSRVVVGLPRLDWIDTESAHLIAALMRTSLAVHEAGLAGRWWLVCGLPECAPTQRLLPLLHSDISQFIDVTVPAVLAPALGPAERAVMASLHAAPHPLPPHTLCACTGLRDDSLGASLRKLASAYLASAGPRAGLGSAAALAEPSAVEIARARAALLEHADFEVPEARLALAGEQSGAALRALAWQLGLRALEEGENALALARMRGSGRLGLGGADELVYARALARSGAADAALGIFDASRDRAGEGRQEPELARLAFELALVGRLPAREAERALRGAERKGRRSGGLDLCVEMRALRAELLLRRKESGRALALLRRKPPGSLPAASPAARHRFMLAQARALLASGRQRGARRCLAVLRAIARPAAEAYAVESLALALAATDTERQDSHRRALALAARSLDGDAVRTHARAIGAQAAEVLATVLGKAEPAPPSPEADPRMGPDAAWQWFSRRGATLLASLDGEQLSVHPPEARANLGLCAWLRVVLSRAGRHSGAQLVQLAPIPNAGKFGGDLLLVSPGFGRLGPTVVALRREQFSDSVELLSAASDPRAILQRALSSGELDPAALRSWLDDWERARPHVR